MPRCAYEIAENVDIYWLDINDSILAVSDSNGAVVKINPESESQWTRLSQGFGGWMVRIDADGIYHGHSGGVTAYDIVEGRQIWHQKTGSVLFGWQEKNLVYAGASDRKIYTFSKTGEAKTIYQCDASVYSCATAAGGKYVFAGDSSSSIYCFEENGKRLWKLGTGCGSALSMQFHQDKVYIVTTDGSLACIDAIESAIAAAELGELPTTKNIATPTSQSVLVSNQVESTNDVSQGVIVECFKQGSKLRVKVISPGYNSDCMVQFSRDIRIEGAKYLVDKIYESTQSSFYRTYGEVKRIIE